MAKPLLDRPAQKCRDIQVFQLRFALRMVGALLPFCASRGQDFMLDWPAWQEPGVLFLKWLIVTGVDYGHPGGRRGPRRGFFHQDWLRLGVQHEGRWRRFHYLYGLLLGADGGRMLRRLPWLEQRGELLRLFAGKARQARPVTGSIIAQDVGDEHIIADRWRRP